MTRGRYTLNAHPRWPNVGNGSVCDNVAIDQAATEYYRMLPIVLVFLALSVLASLGFLFGLKEALRSDHPELHDELFPSGMPWWREPQFAILGWRAATSWFIANDCSQHVCDSANIARYPLYVSALLLATVLFFIVAT